MASSIDFFTATLQSLLTSGVTTTEALVDAYLAHIHKHNHYGMRLNATIIVAPRGGLLQRARALDEERKTSGPRGPRHGIPIIVKDLHCTASLGMPTAAGLFMLANAKVKRDAVTVEKLMDAGALEFDFLKARLDASGRSITGGQIQCPYVRGDLDHNDEHLPIGHSTHSSDGSVVSVAAGFCPFPLATKCARDLVNTTAVLMGRAFDEKVLNAGWKGLEIGILENYPEWMIPPSFCPPNERVDMVMRRKAEKVAAQLTAEGAEVKRNIQLPTRDNLIKDTCLPTLNALSFGVLREGVSQYLENFEPTHTLEGIIATKKENPHFALPPEGPTQDGFENLANWDHWVEGKGSL